MQIVIIEDENYTAEYLKELLKEINTNYDVVKILPTITESVTYFREHSLPDLIFCDIHLADGPGFEIFKNVRIDVPVIFVTAYDQYALQAFKANGIDYILKPFNFDSIKEALEKYQLIYSAVAKKILDYNTLIKGLSGSSVEMPQQKEATSLLIKFGEKIKPVKISEVAYFNTENKSTTLVTLTNKKYQLNKTLDEMEKIGGERFYRVNRQVLINKDAVDEVLQGYARKLLVKLKVIDAPEIIINKTKMSDFLSWLSY